MLQNTKTQNIRVWNKERFFDQEGVNQEKGDLVVPQIHLKKVQSSGIFLISREREMGGARVTDSHRHLGSSKKTA